MSGLPFWHIDAFAAGPFTGNPAGVIRLDRWRDETALQAIAREINLPATAFAVPAEGEADFEIRWFSPRVDETMRNSRLPIKPRSLLMRISSHLSLSRFEAASSTSSAGKRPATRC